MINFERLEEIDLTDEDLFIFQDTETGFKQKISVTRLIAELGLPHGIGPIHLATDVVSTQDYFDLLPANRTLKACQLGIFQEGALVGSPVNANFQLTGADYKNIVARLDPLHVLEFTIARCDVLSLVDNGVDKMTWVIDGVLPFPINPTALSFNLVGGMDDTHAAAIGASTLYSAMTVEDPETAHSFSLATTVDGTDYGPDDGLFIEFAVLALYGPLDALYGIAAPQVLHVNTTP